MAKTNPNDARPERPMENNGDLPAGVRRYDFRMARKLNQAQRIWLGSLHSRLAATLAKELEKIFRCPSEIAFMGLEQVQGSMFQANNHTQTISGEISLQPGNGRLHILWPRDMAFFIVEKLLGGAGDVLFTDKELSEFERDILKKFTSLVFKHLQQAFEGKTPPQGECSGLAEGQDSFSEILPYEVLLLGSLNVRINGHQGKLNIIYPHSVVKSWVDNTAPSPEASATPVASPYLADGLTRGLARAPLLLQVRMNPTRIKVADFTNLQVGDCLLLNHAVKEPMNVFIENKLKFKGHVGARGLQLGLKLTAFSQPAPAQAEPLPGRS